MVSIITEQVFAPSYWCSRYLRGINHEAKRKNIEITMAESAAKLEKSKDGTDVAILIGTSLSWIYETVNTLRRKKIHSVVLSAGRQQNLGSGVSFVTMDYEDAFEKLTKYLESIGKKKTALFAPDPDSAIDQNKRIAFLNTNGSREECDIYYFNATLDDACRNLFDNIDKYDSVICANHISQIVLTKFLNEQEINTPEDVHIAFFGDSEVDREIGDGHTLVRIKAVEAGKLAIRCVRLLQGYSDLSSVALNVRCDIITKKGIIEFDNDTLSPKEADTDTSIKKGHSHIGDALMLEKIFCNCDRVDIEILEGIIRKESYSKIAARVHISENTIGYRIKRLLQFAETASKEEMISALRPYLN